VDEGVTSYTGKNSCFVLCFVLLRFDFLLDVRTERLPRHPLCNKFVQTSYAHISQFFGHIFVADG